MEMVLKDCQGARFLWMLCRTEQGLSCHVIVLRTEVGHGHISTICMETCRWTNVDGWCR